MLSSEFTCRSHRSSSVSSVSACIRRRRDVDEYDSPRSCANLVTASSRGITTASMLASSASSAARRNQSGSSAVHTYSSIRSTSSTPSSLNITGSGCGWSTYGTLTTTRGVCVRRSSRSVVACAGARWMISVEVDRFRFSLKLRHSSLYPPSFSGSTNG